MRIPTLLLLLFTSICSWSQPTKSNSWAEVQQSKKGTVVIHWYKSTLFARTDAGQMSGIEYEIMEGFKKYLQEQYSIDLNIIWREGKTFTDTYNTVRDAKEKGVFGSATFSITQERKKEIGFSPAYMPDISILISSKKIPIVKDVAEFDKVFSKLQAITVKGTTYEDDLLALKKERNIDFKIKYIPVDYVIERVQESDSAFGYITLPNYLAMMNEKSELSIARQNLFTIKREGFAIIFPLTSDWSQPIQEYFLSTQFQLISKVIIDRYFENNAYEFIEKLSNNADDVSLLIHEKEIQQLEIQGKARQIELEARLRWYLTTGIVFILLFMIIILFQYQKRSKANKILRQQKEEIEKQRINIEKQNNELEKQNEKLIQLNEEKNYLIKILAHDLRTPINQVQGLAKILLMENASLSPEQNGIIHNIIESAKRLSAMIGKILDVDAVENDRVNVTLEKVNLSVLLKKVTENFEKTAAKKNIRLQMISTHDNLFVTADTIYLTEIIENLLSNAIKFSQHDTKVEVNARDQSSKVIFSVKDEGPGLTAEDKEKLFQKFQKLSAKATDGEASTGLGLSIIKKYTELMNGTVWCESEAGKGATFFVEFPKALSDQ